jgi:hypothetical protein
MMESLKICILSDGAVIPKDPEYFFLQRLALQPFWRICKGKVDVAHCVSLRFNVFQ